VSHGTKFGRCIEKLCVISCKQASNVAMLRPYETTGAAFYCRLPKCHPSKCRHHSLMYPNLKACLHGQLFLCRAVSRDVAPCRAMSRRVARCRAMSRDVTPCRTMSRRVAPCHAMSRRVAPCLAMSRRVARCHATKLEPILHICVSSIMNKKITVCVNRT
jgi:hypothetical protein